MTPLVDIPVAGLSMKESVISDSPITNHGFFLGCAPTLIDRNELGMTVSPVLTTVHEGLGYQVAIHAEINL